MKDAEMQLTVRSLMIEPTFSEIFSVRNYLTRHKFYRIGLGPEKSWQDDSCSHRFSFSSLVVKVPISFEEKMV